MRGKLPNQPFKQAKYRVESGGLPNEEEVCCTYSASNSFLINKLAIGCSKCLDGGGDSTGIGQSLAAGSLEFSQITAPDGSVILKPYLVNKQSLPAFAKSAKEWSERASASLSNT